MFQRIGRSETLRNQVADYIRKLIRTGRLKPGDRLPTEREMAERFGVSRTVIRDAVKTLSGVGVLEVKHGIGIFVATVDSTVIASQLSSLLINENDTIKSLFKVRMVLETAAAGWAAESCTNEDRLRLKDFIAESRLLLDKKSESPAYHSNNRDFHLLVAEISANPVVVRLMRNMLDLFEETRHHTSNIPGRVDRSVEEHIEVLEAIYHGRAEEASRLMHSHLDSVLKSIKQSRLDDQPVSQQENI